MPKFIKYDKKGNVLDSYPTATLKRMLKSKNPNLRYTAGVILGWEKRGAEMRKQEEKEKKSKVFGLSEKSILRGVQD
jgi:hypothetical protein